MAATHHKVFEPEETPATLQVATGAGILQALISVDSKTKVFDSVGAEENPIVLAEFHNEQGLQRLDLNVVFAHGIYLVRPTGTNTVPLTILWS